MTALIQRWSFVLFALTIGPVGVVASKGVVWPVAIAGAAGVAAWIKDGCPRGWIDPVSIFALAALTLWTAVSTAWTFSPADALVLIARLAALSIFGAGLLFTAVALDDRHRRFAHNALLVGIAIAFVLLVAGFVYGKKTGDALWGRFFFDPLTTLNNGAITISLLAWPAFALLWRRDRRWHAAICAGAIFGLLAFLSSGAAMMAPVVGVVGFLIVYWFRKRGALVIAAVLAVLVILSPQVANYLLPVGKVHATTAQLPPSAQHRLNMWRFAVEKIDEKPIWGWGMDASRSIPQDDRRLATNMEIMPLHPHNAFLQARLELGLPGAAIIAVLIGALFAGPVGNIGERASRAFAAGAACAYVAVAAVSYGMWQNWWVAFAWALVGLTAGARRPATPG